MFNNILSFVEIFIFRRPIYFNSPDFRELLPFDIFVHKFVDNLSGFKVIRDSFWSEDSYSDTHNILRSRHILNLPLRGFIEHSNQSRFPGHDDCVSEDVVDLVEHCLVFEMNVISLVFFIDFPAVEDRFKDKGVFLFGWRSQMILVELENNLLF